MVILDLKDRLARRYRLGRALYVGSLKMPVENGLLSIIEARGQLLDGKRVALAADGVAVGFLLELSQCSWIHVDAVGQTVAAVEFVSLVPSFTRMIARARAGNDERPAAQCVKPIVDAPAATI